MTITKEIRKETKKLLENGEKFSTICKKMKISRPTLNKIRKNLQKSEDATESEDGTESVSESERSESERSESLQSEENFTKEILLRGRNYQSESESDIEPEPESNLDNENIRNYLSRFQDEAKERVPTQDPKPEKAEAPRREIHSNSQNEQKVSQSESKQAKIIKIQSYFRAFAMKCAPLTAGVQVEVYIQNLQSKNEEELDGILSAIRYRISNSGLSDGAHLAFITAARGVENISCRFGLKLQGYADSLATNQNIRDILTEMSIEYLSDTCLQPHKRLLLICGLQAYSIHTKNSTEELLKNVLDQEVDESKFDCKVNDEFK